MIDNLSDLSGIFDYLWIGYIVFLLVVALITFALLYHWSAYAQIKALRFRFAQILFLLVLVFLVMLSGAFFIKI